MNSHNKVRLIASRLLDKGPVYYAVPLRPIGNFLLLSLIYSQHLSETMLKR